MGTSPENVGGRNPSKALPDYASKIRELRKTAGLTQPQFAAELNVKRSAVAKWEGGVREPRHQNYRALADFATNRHLLLFSDFFLFQIARRKSDRQREAEGADAMRYLETVEADAAAGDELAQHLLELSRREPKEFVKGETKRIIEARETLDNGAFEAKLFEIVDEMQRVRDLIRGRQTRVIRRIANLRRRYERMPPLDTTLAEAERVQKQKIAQILDQAEVDIRAGKPSYPKDLLGKIQGTYTGISSALQGRKKTLDRLGEVWKIMSSVPAAEMEKRGLLGFLDPLERALGVDREPEEPKGRKKATKNNEPTK